MQTSKPADSEKSLKFILALRSVIPIDYLYRNIISRLHGLMEARVSGGEVK
jgi:hypothetical protein